MGNRRAISWLPVVVLVVLAGCASQKSSAPSAAVAPPADVAGTWVGAVTGGQQSPVTMTLDQSGNKVTGDLRVGGRTDVSGPVEGTVEGNTIKLRLQTGAASAPVMTVKGDQITGIVGGTTVSMTRRR
jgi:hypothetical protein